MEDTTGESHLQTKCVMSTLWAYRKIGSGHSLGKLGPNHVCDDIIVTNCDDIIVTNCDDIIVMTSL